MTQHDNESARSVSNEPIRIESKFLSAAHQSIKQRKAHIREILIDKDHEIDGIFDDINLDDPTVFHPTNINTNQSINSSILQLEAEFQSIHQSLLKPLIDSSPVDFRSFEQDVANTAVILDEISLESVQQRERELANQSINQSSQSDDAFTSQWNALVDEHDRLMASIKAQHEASIKQTVDHSTSLSTSHKKWMSQIEEAMEKVKIRMIASINEQRRLINQLYGDLTVSKSLTWSSLYQTHIQPYFNNRFHKVVGATHLTHSIISIRFDCLRAVKSKLPAGTYTIMATLYSRLGDRGERMTVNQSIYRSHDEHIPIKHYDYTRVPQRHSGLAQAVELCFDQPINQLYLALENDAVTITSCLLIEVIALKGSIYQSDRTVAYQYWPISDLAHQLNTGLIKLPMMRGDPRDGEFDRERTIKQSYHHFQAKITNNVDRWLCNCYLTIDMQSIDKHSVMQLRPSQYDHLINQSVPVSSAAKQAKLKELAIHNAALREISRSANEKKIGNFGSLIFKTIMGKTSTKSTSNDVGLTSSEHQREWEKVTAMKRRFTQLAVYHSSCHQHASQAHHRLASRTRSSKFALAKLFLHEITLSINRSIHLSKRTLFKFVILFAFMFVIQFLIHYLAHYWALTKALTVQVHAINIKFGKVSFDFYNQPINQFLTQPITPYTKFSPGVSLMFLIISFYGNIAFSLILLIAFSIIHRWAHLSLPHFAYESMLIYCGHCIISPVYSLIVNAAYGELYTDEWASVISAFNGAQMSFLGPILCIAVVSMLVSLHVIILLLFVLFEWEAGSMIDVFARLVATESQFYVPLDLEVSSRIVLASLTESARWKGMKGGRRRVMVTQYLPNETADRSGESLLHVSIWNVTQRQRLQKTKNMDQVVDMAQMPNRASVDSFERSFTRAQASSFSTSSTDFGRNRQSSLPSKFMVTEEKQEELPPIDIQKKAPRETRDSHRHFLRQADGAWVELIDGCESYGGDRLASLELKWLDEQDKLFDHHTEQDQDQDGDDQSEDSDDDNQAQSAEQVVVIDHDAPPRITMTRQSSQLQLVPDDQAESEHSDDDDDDQFDEFTSEAEEVIEQQVQQPIVIVRQPKRGYRRRMHNRLGSLHGLTIKEEEDEPDD